MTKDEETENSLNSSQQMHLKDSNTEDDGVLGFNIMNIKKSETTSNDLNFEIDFEKIDISKKSSIFLQTKLMVWKNCLIFSRNFKATLFQLMAPLLICVFLVGYQEVIDNYGDRFIEKTPEIRTIENIERCKNPENCITIGYGIISSQNKTYDYIDNIMKTVSDENNLEYNQDVKLLTVGDTSSFTNYLIENQNKTSYGVVFCIDNMDYGDVTVPCKLDHLNDTFHLYTILYNFTNAPNIFLTSLYHSFPSYSELTKLKLDIDNAFLKYYAKKRGLSPSPQINATIQTFPRIPNKAITHFDVIGTFGGFFFLFPPMISFVFILLEIIKEKDLKLRKSLLIIGLKNSSFWLSWLVTSIVLSLLNSAFFLVCGIFCDFDVFINSPYLVIFSLFFLFTLSLQFLGYFLTTVLKTIKSANTISYSFFLIAMVMQVFMNSNSISYYLYAVDRSLWIKIVTFIIQLYPPFNFALAISDIGKKATVHFDNFEMKLTNGGKFYWSDLFERIKGKTKFNLDYEMPSAGESMSYFFVDMLLFAVLAWYFDHVDSSNRGKTYGYLFFLEKSYWTTPQTANISDSYKKAIAREISELSTEISKSEHKMIDSVYSVSTHENQDYLDAGCKTVLEEKIDILKREREGGHFEGVRILGCSKTYFTENQFCGGRLVKALKNIYVEVPVGELFTILGHNGAGKSTLINVLTGNISPSYGTAKISNFDILKDPLAVEELIGLCPQHDILWDELTAREHIELYAYLRNYPEEYIAKLVESKLKEVNLLVQAEAETRTYSGGMKRRLSILLATVGRPKVIFLDEPTTGLDPVNKRFIWSMVQRIKQNKAVILTTHSMEEADFLSDRIGVIVDGSFKCIGNSIELKTIYGGGYLLTFICERENIEEVQTHIKTLMPSSTLLDSSGGSIILNLPFDKVNEMKHFISILNHKFTDPAVQPLEGLIKECGMNYTTLEEIFLKITSKKSMGKQFSTSESLLLD